MESSQSEGLLVFQADHVWIERNREKLLAQYPDQWIAVEDRTVIASDPDLNNLLRRLPDPANTCVEYVTREPMETIL